MGQYLTIGIATKCSTSKEDLQKHKITTEELLVKMQEEYHFEPSIYDMTETEDRYVFNLKPTILEKQLLPFLKKLYPKLYLGSSIDYTEIIELLESSAPDTWLDWLKDNGEEAFQLDSYGTSDYLYFDKPFRPYIRLSFSNIIMLSLEGKISMETYGRQFTFFKYCLQEAFKEFSLAKAVRIYFTG